MPITLNLTRQPTVPLEAEVLTPNKLAELSSDEIRSLIVYHGKRQLPLGEFFDVEGAQSEDLVIHGALHKVRWIGRAMSKGSITIHGNVGMHVGAYMAGGRIEVHGHATDWIGAEMRNGFIHIHGNVGGQVGAAYRGSLLGMRDGTIIVDGFAGLEVGMRMKGGMIVIGGPAKDFTGLQMKGGTIVLMSGAEIRTGAWMVRGTIVSLKPLKLLPTFSYACAYTPSFLRMYARHLHALGVTIPVAGQAGAYLRFNGDCSV